MTQHEAKRGLAYRADVLLGTAACKTAPAYTSGGILAMETGASSLLGLMPFEIRRTKPVHFRGGYANARTMGII
jgi:hypothetical protein